MRERHNDISKYSLLDCRLGILSVPANAQEKMYSAQDLNELMARVWQNCKIDLDNLRGYIFNEKDTVVGKKFPLIQVPELTTRIVFIMSGLQTMVIWDPV